MSEQRFIVWLAKVNEYVYEICEMEIDDLPDWHYRDAYDEGLSPYEASVEVVMNADY